MLIVSLPPPPDSLDRKAFLALGNVVWLRKYERSINKSLHNTRVYCWANLSDYSLNIYFLERRKRHIGFAMLLLREWERAHAFLRFWYNYFPHFRFFPLRTMCTRLFLWVLCSNQLRSSSPSVKTRPSRGEGRVDRLNNKSAEYLFTPKHRKR